MSNAIKKYITEYDVPQSDWNINDENNKAFIKNKPLYDSREWVQLYDGIYSSMTMYGVTLLLADDSVRDYDFSNVRKIKVLFDDVEYELEGKLVTTTNEGTSESIQTLVFGNLAIAKANAEAAANLAGTTVTFDQEMIDSGEPFEVENGSMSLKEPVTDMHVAMWVEEGELVKLDPKYLPDNISGTQSDWLENNETSASYVQNRTHYKETDSTSIEIDTSKYTFMHEFGLYVLESTDESLKFTTPPSEGDPVTVIWDGVTYNLTAFTDPHLGAMTVGDSMMALMGQETPVYNFAIMFMNDYISFMSLNDPSNIIINISIEKNYYTILDRNYLPKFAGEDVSGKIFTVDDRQEIAMGGAEIFNDYANNIASVMFSHAEGTGTKATNTGAHAEGGHTTASGNYSHAEGGNTEASAYYTHAEGYKTKATSDYAHAEGKETVSSGNYTHAEGYKTIASSLASHAEGTETTASFNSAHAEGQLTTAAGQASHAEGTGTHVRSKSQHVQGEYNIIDTIAAGYERGTYAHIVGNGTADDARSNAHTLSWDGTAWFANTVKVGGTSQDDENAKLLAVEPDWLENDETSTSYIQNRTHYIENNVTVLEETTVECPAILCELNGNAFMNVVPGQPYTVLFDGVEYDREVKRNNDMLYLGNINLFSNSSEDTGEPFFIMLNLPDIIVQNTDTHTIQIVGISDVITLSGSTDYMMRGVDGVTMFNADETYTVVFDDVTYTFIAKEIQGMAVCIGNLSIMDPSEEDNGAPFVFATADYSTMGSSYGIVSMLITYDGTHTYTISGIDREITYKVTGDSTEKKVENVAFDIDYTKLYEGSQYTVVYNGKEYNCTYSNGQIGGYFFGVNEKEPFSISFNDDNSCDLFYDESGLNSISISLDEYYHKLDEKFIPDELKIGCFGTGLKSIIFNDIDNNIASGDYSHAEGCSTEASGKYSHAEGDRTIASGDWSHAEGSNTKATYYYSHAEGYATTASGSRAHAEGRETVASNMDTHAEGYKAKATGDGAHAEGGVTIASGDYSHVEGIHNIAAGHYQHVQGKYNIEDSENKYAHIVGNGSSDSAKSNAHTLDWSGNAEFQGDVIAYGCGGESPISLKALLDRIISLETELAELKALALTTITDDGEGNVTIE